MTDDENSDITLIIVLFFLLQSRDSVDWGNISILQKKKAAIWLSPMTKAPTLTEKYKKATTQHKNATKNVHYTTIANRLGTVSWSEKGRDLTQSYDQSCYTDRKIQKATWQHKNATKTSITQWLRTDLGRSAGAMISTQLVCLNPFTGSQPSNQPRKMCNQRPTANQSGEAIKIITQTCKVIKTVYKNK